MRPMVFLLYTYLLLLSCAFSIHICFCILLLLFHEIIDLLHSSGRGTEGGAFPMRGAYYSLCLFLL
jgi:hypothetical protein